MNKEELFKVRDALTTSLPLIRACIMELSLRGDLAKTVRYYRKSISVLPWSNTELREKKEGRGSVDMHTILLNIVWSLDEYIVEPIKTTKILPDYHRLRPLLWELNKAFIKADFCRSSIFREYLNDLASIVTQYVKNGKIKALRDIFYSLLSEFKERDFLPPQRLMYEAFRLPNSLLKKLKPTRRRDLFELCFLTEHHIYRFIKENPESFASIPSRGIEEWKALIEECDPSQIKEIIVALASVDKRIDKYEERTQKRVEGKFSEILSKIKEKLKEHHLRATVDEHKLLLEDTEHVKKYIMSLENVLSKKEAKHLEQFISKYLRSS